mgnify:CR=1 FL=1
MDDAVINIHLPKNKEMLTKAIDRFKYQELMYFFVNIKLLRDKLASKAKIKLCFIYGLLKYINFATLPSVFFNFIVVNIILDMKIKASFLFIEG